MPPNIDVWRVAQLLITNHGGNAEVRARRSLEHCQRNGVVEGVAFWRRVEAAIGELRRMKPTGRVP